MHRSLLVLALAAPLAACASEPADPASPAPRPMTVRWQLFLDNQPASCAELGLTDIALGFQGGTFETCYPDSAQGDETVCVPVSETAPCDAGAFSLMPSDTTTKYDFSMGAQVPDGPNLLGAGALASGGTRTFSFMVADLGIDWTIAAPDGTYDTLEISDGDFAEKLPYTATGSLHAFALASTAEHLFVTLSSSQTGARYTTDQWVNVPAAGTAVTLDITPTP